MSKPVTLARVVNCLALWASCVAAVPLAAQTQPAPQRRDAPPAASATVSPSPTPADAAGAPGEPDLSITANVTARELQFEVVPTPKVEFPGRPRRDTVWEAERTNLPPQVQPGVTYRDIGIRLKITSVFADIERIVAEALGEIPASDDAPPEINSNENARPPGGNAPGTNSSAEPGDAVPPPVSLTQTQPAPASRTRPPRVRTGSARARGERP